MVKENNLIIENKKPFEVVQEVGERYEIPSFEEFMKSYEGNVNYADLSGGDIGEVKGYGPCVKNGKVNYDNCHCSSEELDRQLKVIRNMEAAKVFSYRRFRLGITLTSGGTFSSCMDDGCVDYYGGS